MPKPSGKAGESVARAAGGAGARRSARQDARARQRGGAPESAVADTGARGQGFGLSTGGGAGSGSYLDVGNFCCPDYLVTMIERIRGELDPQRGISAATSMVKFTINRDGASGDIVVEKIERIPPRST